MKTSLSRPGEECGLQVGRGLRYDRGGHRAMRRQLSAVGASFHLRGQERIEQLRVLLEACHRVLPHLHPEDDRRIAELLRATCREIESHVRQLSSEEPTG